jgi:hypothetical protein
MGSDTFGPQNRKIDPAVAARLFADPVILAQAMAEPLAHFSIDTPTTRPEVKGWAHDILRTAQAMVLLALMAHADADRPGPEGGTVGARFLEQLRHMISPGKEPSCRGGISGWCDNQAAQALALARRTPAVWARLSADEIERCDLVMKCLLFAGNHCHNFRNNPKANLSQDLGWAKEYNPNHVEGYVGVMIAGWVYFGGSRPADEALASFDFDRTLQACDKHGFTNIAWSFRKAGKALMETGGTDRLGGQVAGVRLPFTYKDLVDEREIPYDPAEIYASLSRRMFFWTPGRATNRLGTLGVDGTVRDFAGNVRGRVADGALPPAGGDPGICFEYLSGDASGIRTSSRYVYDGLRNHLITRATLSILGLLPKSPESRALDDRMKVGMDDFFFKLAHGYLGWSNGKEANVLKEFGSDMGYAYVKHLWSAFR